MEALRTKYQAYKELSKSGIVTLVLISVFGGFIAGHSPQIPFDFLKLFLTLGGILFLSSGSSALNQLQERKIDAQMKRTATRPLPSGRLSPTEALTFIISASTVGLGFLYFVSLEVFILGALAMLCYNVLYTLWWKKRWAFAAVPGAVPGALPILMGYAAAHGSTWTPGGLYLFFILFFWQMPHFWVLALKYSQDYASGGIPTLPVKMGSKITLKHIVLWGFGYVAIALMAPLFFQLSWIYIGASSVMSAVLLVELFLYFKKPDSKHWLRFFLWINFSLIIYIAALNLDLWRHTLFSSWFVGD